MNAPAGQPAPGRREAPSATNSPALPGGSPLQSALPILLFLGVNRIAGLRWAVVVATLWSIKVIVDRKRKGLPLGRFMPIVTAAVIIRGAIGAITGSETLYFGLGIASKYLVAVVLFGSILLKKPLAGRAADFALQLPAAAKNHPSFRPTMAIITALGATYYAISATFDVWLFQRSDVEGFVIWRFVANWPLSTATIVAILAITQRRLQRIPGLAPLSTLVEQRFAPFLPEEAIRSSPEGPETTTHDD